MPQKNDQIFRDWIPEGEDPGAIGDGGFRDFVPEPEPKPQVIKEPVKEDPKPKVKK